MLAQQVREKEKMDKLKREMHTLSINSFLQWQISVKSLNSEQGSHQKRGKKCEPSSCSLVLNHEHTQKRNGCSISSLTHCLAMEPFHSPCRFLPKKKIAPNLWLNEEQAALSFDGMK